jgi:CDGSH-type Zn-finger protein
VDGEIFKMMKIYRLNNQVKQTRCKCKRNVLKPLKDGTHSCLIYFNQTEQPIINPKEKRKNILRIIKY